MEIPNSLATSTTDIKCKVGLEISNLDIPLAIAMYLEDECIAVTVDSFHRIIQIHNPNRAINIKLVRKRFDAKRHVANITRRNNNASRAVDPARRTACYYLRT
jgi:hypothetical protein